MSWPDGKMLMSGKYRIVRKLGVGGFGETYLAENILLKKKVVIKSPTPDKWNNQDHDSYIKRFRHEGQILSKICHPNIVQVIDLDNDRNTPFLVMEYIDGMTLNELIQDRGYLGETEALKYFRKLSEALHEVHSKELFHCDIHPGNIMFRKVNNGLDPVIIDFGSAQPVHPMTSIAAPAVLESFAPPEYREGKPQATWDIYGLAASFYFTLTGNTPQSGVNRMLYGDKLESPDTHHRVSATLNQAIISGMAIKPNERTRTMKEFLDSFYNPKNIQEYSKQNVRRFERQITYLIQDFKQYLRRNNIGIPNISELAGMPDWIRSNSGFPWMSLLLVFGYFPIGIMLGLAREEPWIWVGTFIMILTGAGLSIWISTPNELNYSSSSESRVLEFMIGLGILWAIEGVWVGGKVLAWSWTISWAWLWVWSLQLLFDNEVSLALVWLGISTTPIIGMIVGQFKGIGYLWGLVWGLLSLVQFTSITSVLFIPEVVQSSRYKSKIRNMLICGLAPSIGVIIGGIIGWSVTGSKYFLPL